jgi:hypothetical protein
MTIWANVMAGVAIGIFLAILALGAYTFKPHRARNVKYAEQEMAISEHVIEVRNLHPEIVKVSRLDRHPWFIGAHLCVLGYSLCVFGGAKLTSNVLALGDVARYTMATCFFVGSVLVLTGVALGSRLGPWRIARRVRYHATASVLGDDIVLPYRIEMGGMSAMAVSSGIYAWTSFQSTAGSLGGWLTLGIAVLCVLSVISFYRAAEVFQRGDTTLIREAEARLEAGDAAHAD